MTNPPPEATAAWWQKPVDALAYPFRFARVLWRYHSYQKGQSNGTVDASSKSAEQYELERVVRCYELAFGGYGYSGVKPQVRLTALDLVADYLEANGTLPGFTSLSIDAIESRRVVLKELEAKSSREPT
jgi:hypothetical protein